jgi:hypothetical protein
VIAMFFPRRITLTKNVIINASVQKIHKEIESVEIISFFRYAKKSTLCKKVKR